MSMRRKVRQPHKGVRKRLVVAVVTIHIHCKTTELSEGNVDLRGLLAAAS